MSYIPPDILDNHNSASSLAHALNQTVTAIGQRRLDVATGYFAPEVWRLVGASFAELGAMRMLLGEQPEVPYANDATTDLRRYFRRTIASDLAQLDLDPAHTRLVDSLIAFLERDATAVRLFSGPFLHAKAYIFERVSFVGSSNFTPAGLTRNSELTLSSTNQGTANELRQWFEGKWATSEDYKPDLIAALRESKFGSKPYRPFDVFIKALYEYFKDRIALEPEQAVTVDLARFQEEGKLEATRLLDRWGGVLIADAVGLGKTYIGLSLLERELIHKRRRGHTPRGLLICPAQLRDLVWRPRLAEYGIPVVDILSQEEIGRESFDWKRYSHVDVVLVDESHNFRNPNTNRYRTLSKIISGGRRKRVILMTATPVNNTLFDLYYQLLLLARGDDHFYRSMGIANLRNYFKAALDGGVEIFDLLEATTVRRSRNDIRRREQAGEEIIVNGKRIHFPERRLERITYDLDGAYQGFYGAIVTGIERLNLVAYNLAAYAHAQSRENQQSRQRNEALIALLKMLYLKRLESSAAAFEVSMERQASFQERFLATLQQGRLLDAAGYRKLLAVEADDADTEAPERVEETLAALQPVTADAYDMQTIAACVQEDITTLREITDRVRHAREQSERGEQADGQSGDDKLRQLKTLLAGALKGQKALVFTSYHDTARFIARQLTGDEGWRQRTGQPVVGLITGETKADERQRIVERFAPNANRPAQEEGGLFWQPPGPEIQLLISTDVLAEGQNLQDAGVIINYDLHWNPVRLIQRAGRVDRIGSEFSHIALYNVFPEDELESLLGLVRRLAVRIAQIDHSVGLDASVLGEAISERSLDQLRQLHRNDQAVLADLERQAELISTEDMKSPLMAYIQQIGEGQLADLPMGIHSGKGYRARDARPGWFVAFTARDRHFWRFYPDDGGEPERRIRAIYPMIACASAEERTPPGPIPYELLERATHETLTALRGEQTHARTTAPMRGVAMKLYHWLNRPSLWDANHQLDPEQLRRFNAVLVGTPLAPFEKDHALKRLVKAYEQEGAFTQLVDDLDAFFTENGLYQGANADVATLEAIKDEELRLVCFERLTPRG